MFEPLPIVDSCDGCGVCCLEQDAPPGYLEMLYPPELVVPHLWTYTAEDYERLASLPPEALAELKAYHRAAQSHQTRRGQPCIWFDQEQRRCRWYEHRPGVCRDFERNAPACHRWRAKYGIGDPSS
jgi:uncharacterized protein